VAVNPDDKNVSMLEEVAEALGPLTKQAVFLGGCAVGLLIVDKGRPPVRVTNDVDLAIEAKTRVEYYALADKLRERGFREDPESGVICRWRLGELVVDIMPTKEGLLGFPDGWYQDALLHASTYTLPSGAQVNLVTAPHFLATKLEAFRDRGNGDFLMSKDMEDIVAVVDGRPQLPDEVASADPLLRDYLRDEVESLLSDRSFLDALPGQLPGDEANQARLPLIIERLRKIAGF
jgi:predicted nucleotidyltransferase